MNKTFTTIAFAALMVTPAIAQDATAQSQSLSQSGAVINQNSRSVQQAPGAYAPGLAAAGIETCTASASSGISGPGFGFSFGATSIDEGCDARLDARTLVGVGLKGSAVLRLCEREKMALAMAQSGEFICPQIRFAEQPRQTSQRRAAPAAQRQAAPARQTGKRSYNPSTNTWN